MNRYRRLTEIVNEEAETNRTLLLQRLAVNQAMNLSEDKRKTIMFDLLIEHSDKRKEFIARYQELISIETDPKLIELYRTYLENSKKGLEYLSREADLILV